MKEGVERLPDGASTPLLVNCMFLAWDYLSVYLE